MVLDVGWRHERRVVWWALLTLIAIALGGVAYVVYQFVDELHRGSAVSWAPECSTTASKFGCVVRGQEGVGWAVLPGAVLVLGAGLARARVRKVAAGGLAIGYVAAAVVCLQAVLATLVGGLQGAFFLPSGALAVRCVLLLAETRRPPPSIT